MFCSQCGAELPHTAMYCPVCGHPVEQQVQMVRYQDSRVSILFLVEQLLSDGYFYLKEDSPKTIQYMRQHHLLYLKEACNLLAEDEVILACFAGNHCDKISNFGVHSDYLLTDRRLLRVAPADKMNVKGILQGIRQQLSESFLKRGSFVVSEVSLAQITHVEMAVINDSPRLVFSVKWDGRADSHVISSNFAVLIRTTELLTQTYRTVFEVVHHGETKKAVESES